jgi:NAD(P)-dependent dehydrogenase (short-subunit alcohol dehydrogenase family)
MTGGIAGKVALITGGTAGIGEASARLLARHGCKVLIVGRSREKGQRIVTEIAASGGIAQFYAADLSDSHLAAHIVDEAVRRFGGLDIAFNNVGAREPDALVGDQTLEAFDAAINLNLRSVFISMKAEIAAMRANGGVIVNNASVSGVRNSNAGLGAYAASKAALISLTRTAAMEYAAQGIRINVFSPGKILTPMARSYKMDLGAIANTVPAKRLGTEEEAAEAVYWMVSPASSWLIGHNLCLDGGFLAS